MSAAAMGARVRFCGHNATFIADIYRVEGANVVRAIGPVNDKTLKRPAIGATHHLIDFPSAGFWRPDLGVFVVPERQVADLRLAKCQKRRAAKAQVFDGRDGRGYQPISTGGIAGRPPRKL